MSFQGKDPLVVEVSNRAVIELVRDSAAIARNAERLQKSCDLSTTCPNCTSQMEPEHAHYRCSKCGYRDSCCF